MWSSGNSVAAILMLMMEDRGHLKYDEAVASYWPEFAKHQKGKIKVEDVLRHESGLSNFKQRINVKFTSTENIKKNKIGEVIEDEHVEFPFGCYRYYHGVTRDLITNEIFRRVEPKKRTMSEFLNEELKPLFGDEDLDIHISVADEDLDRCFDFRY